MNTKVHIGDHGPAADLVAKAVQEHTVTDNLGRDIVLRKPGVLAQYNIVKIVGQASSNEVYMAMVMPLIYVASINGEKVPTPKSQLEIDALIQRLDEEGIEAVMKGVEENFTPQDKEKTKEEIKN